MVRDELDSVTRVRIGRSESIQVVSEDESAGDGIVTSGDDDANVAIEIDADLRFDEPRRDIDGLDHAAFGARGPAADPAVQGDETVDFAHAIPIHAHETVVTGEVAESRRRRTMGPHAKVAVVRRFVQIDGLAVRQNGVEVVVGWRTEPGRDEVARTWNARHLVGVEDIGFGRRDDRSRCCVIGRKYLVAAESRRADETPVVDGNDGNARVEEVAARCGREVRGEDVELGAIDDDEARAVKCGGRDLTWLENELGFRDAKRDMLLATGTSIQILRKLQARQPHDKGRRLTRPFGHCLPSELKLKDVGHTNSGSASLRSGE